MLNMCTKSYFLVNQVVPSNLTWDNLMWFAVRIPVQNSVSSYEMLKGITKVLYMTFVLYWSFKYVLLLNSLNNHLTKIHYTNGRMLWMPQHYSALFRFINKALPFCCNLLLNYILSIMVGFANGTDVFYVSFSL